MPVAVCLFAPFVRGEETNVLLTTVAALSERIYGAPTPPVAFDLTAIVVRVGPEEAAVADDSGFAILHNMHRKPLQPGDVIHVRGWLDFEEFGHAGTKRIDVMDVIGHTTPPRPEQATLEELEKRASPFLAETEGVVTDVFRDEIDRRNTFLTLRDGSFKLTAALPRKIEPNAAVLLGARIRANGYYCRIARSFRTYAGSILMIDGRPQILVPPTKDPFDVPSLAFYPLRTPEEIDRLPRQSVTGLVLAAWRENQLLVRSSEGPLLGAELLTGVELPHVGETIRLAGKPATDLFRLNLVEAICQRLPVSATIHEAPEDIDPNDLMDESAHPKATSIPRYQGQTVRIVGVVDKLLDADTPDVRLNLTCGDLTVPIWPGFAPAESLHLEPGTRISATGTCVFESDNWQPNRIFPHVSGPSIILRDADDIRVLSRPPWWTPRRMLTLITLLLVGLLVFVFWNRCLNHLVNRRSHELAREKLKKESAQLKIGERTRLAVELHDSLSQNLEGVACQVVATRNVLKTDPAAAAACLETTERMLDSCRLELRRCLFDLRGNALEEKNLADAIRTTLAPLCDGVDLNVRFDVRRANFNDTSTHATLCMIRELVSNALRHGQASQIRVAGECHDGLLSFSVRDNGCGFDTKTRPGPNQGHFGLEGIRERAERFDGSAVLESRPGSGTRVTVTLKLSAEKENEPT